MDDNKDYKDFRAFAKDLREHSAAECQRGWKTRTLLIEAAVVIEELSKRERFLRGKIADALDALDRGADNDWARKALEEAEKEIENG